MSVLFKYIYILKIYFLIKNYQKYKILIKIVWYKETYYIIVIFFIDT